MSDKDITRREFNTGATVATASVISGAASSVIANTNEAFDIVLKNGRVMDPETRLDRVANVGIKDGKIVAITSESLDTGRQIDCTGHVVCPGFIDTHYHWSRPMGDKLALRDGRTTVMDLEMGTLGTLVDDWYAQRAGSNQINYGCASAHEFARALVLDDITTPDTPEAMNRRGA